MPIAATLTPLQRFVSKWKDCQGCPLHKTRTQIVLARGKIPCDVLFIGEGPGLSEDVLGLPFIGPAGKILDHILQQSIPDSISYAITNLVCCIPVDPDTGAKAVEPEEAHIKACSQRLREFVALCNPKLLVCVGSLAKDYCEPGWKHSVKLGYTGPTLNTIHPAAILRMNTAGQGLAIQKCIVQLRNAVEDLQ
jgi:uracil-DNA glycosylase